MSSMCPLGSVIDGYLSGVKPKSDIHPDVHCMVMVLADRLLCCEAALTLVVWSPGGGSCSHEPGGVCEYLEPIPPHFSSGCI